MYTSRTALILFIILIIGTMLQFIAVFSIGWDIYTDKDTHFSTYSGLWFYKTCDDKDNCKTRSFYDDYKDSRYFLPRVEYAYIVGPQVKAVLSLVFCLVSTVLSYLIYRDHAYKLRFCMLNACLLFVSGSLIWTEIGSRSAAIAVWDLKGNATTIKKFPYSLFLSALGSSATLLVGLINLVALWKNNFQRSDMLIENFN